MSTTTFGAKGPRDMGTAIAGSAIVYGTVVKRGADQSTLVQGTAACVPVGIATDNQETIGREFPFAFREGEMVEGRSGAAFALDALLASDANGKLVSAVSGNPIAAVAREASTGVDLWVVAEIAPDGRLMP
jgi:hypothetical protein